MLTRAGWHRAPWSLPYEAFQRAELELAAGAVGASDVVWWCVSRLSKREVEKLLDSYDDDPVQSLRTALSAIRADQWLLETIAEMSTNDRDALVRDLVEWRGLTPP